MIISHKYKYLFIELPRTGTEAIKNELIMNYDGHEIYSKHSKYHKFLKNASIEEKKYFTFSCIRDPFERTLSLYNKIKNDQYGQWSNFKKTRYKKISSFLFYRRYKFVNSKDVNFYDFLKKYYIFPYDDWACLDHDKFDYIINFNNLNNDFSNVLDKLNIKKIRNLPIVNKTNKKDIIHFEDLSYKYKKIFIPYILNNRTLFDEKYSDLSVGYYQILKYKFLNFFKVIYWRLFY